MSLFLFVCWIWVLQIFVSGNFDEHESQRSSNRLLVIDNRDRGSYGKLERLKPRSSHKKRNDSSSDLIENNELVKMVKKGPYRQRSPSSMKTTIGNNQYGNFLQVLDRVSYEGNDHCVLPITSQFGQNFRVVIFVDKSYFPVFQNWLVFFASVCGKKSIFRESIDLHNQRSIILEVVCLDADVERAIESVHLSCSKYSTNFQNFSTALLFSRTDRTKQSNDHENDNEEKRYRSFLWVQRMKAVHDMVVKDSWNVLLSDLDALWINDPIPSIIKHLDNTPNNHHKLHYEPIIIASQGHWPDEVFRKWGSTICMGFVFFPTADRGATSTLFQPILAKWEGNRSSKDSLHLRYNNALNGYVVWDDQYALNTALAGYSVAWEQVGPVLGELANRNVGSKNLGSSQQSWWGMFFGKEDSSVQLEYPIHRVDVAYRGSVAMGASTSTVILLPQNSFVRDCLVYSHYGNVTERAFNRVHIEQMLVQEDVKVMHCRGGMRTSGSAVHKIRFLKELGLWRLED